MMECNERVRRAYILAMAMQHVQQIHMNIHNYLQRIKRLRRRGQRRRLWQQHWVSLRKQFGLYDQLLVELRQEDQTSFKNFMRMPVQMYDEILQRIQHRILKQYTWFREPIEPGLKLAATLRHLASGSTYADLKYAWRVPANTLSKIIREVCNVIIDEYTDEVMTPPSDSEEWKAIADHFMHRWHFPHCCGALDGKHIAIKKPAHSGSIYHNYKGFFSITLLALVDADYKFIWADVGGNGACSDAQLFNESELKEAAEDGTIGFPDAEPLPNDTEDVPYYMIGDDAFALRTTMMKPYSHRTMYREERIFSYRLSRARRVVENAFGILANRFRILLSTMGHSVSTVRLIVKTCLILHNLMRIRYPGLQNQQLDDEHPINRDLITGAWRQGPNLQDTQNVTAANIDSKKGKMQRNLIKHWVNSPAGSVAWQDRMI